MPQLLADTYVWSKEFKPFTTFHFLVAGTCIATMIGSWWIGRNWRGTPKEARFRIAWGWLILLYKIAETTWYCWPSRFNMNDSLPLQLCDLAAFIAAGAMITQRRWLRSLLYFWGLGLSTQAFFTPILRNGYAFPEFWFFWISHTMIIGSAAYDIIVRGYRPHLRDVVVAFLVTVACAIVVTPINLHYGVNYFYIGNTKPQNPTLIDKLGSWPGRVFTLAAIVIVEFVLLWGVWRVAPIFRRPRGSQDASSTES